MARGHSSESHLLGETKGMFVSQAGMGVGSKEKEACLHAPWMNRIEGARGKISHWRHMMRIA